MSAAARPTDEIRDLRRRLSESRNGGVELDRAELVERLTPPAERVEGDDPREVARYVQRLLMFHGLRPRPRVDDLGAPTTTVQLDRGLAIQGAVVVAVLAALVGAVGSPIYGVLLGVAGLAGVAIVTLAFGWLAERAPQWLPRGRSLGVAIAVPLVVLVFIGGVLPIRASRMHQATNPGFAASLLQGARDAINAGDLKTADDRIVQASFADPNSPDLTNVRNDLVVARVKRLLDEQARKTGIYDRAQRAYRAHRVRLAIRLMSRVKGFRDADQRLADFRAGRP